MATTTPPPTTVELEQTTTMTEKELRTAVRELASMGILSVAEPDRDQRLQRVVLTLRTPDARDGSTGKPAAGFSWKL